MVGRLRGAVVLVLLLAGILVLPAGGAGAVELVFEWDERVEVGAPAFVRGTVPAGASGVRAEALVDDEWVESDVGVLDDDGGFEIELTFDADAVGVRVFRVVVDIADDVVIGDDFEVERVAAVTETTPTDSGTTTTTTTVAPDPEDIEPTEESSEVAEETSTTDATTTTTDATTTTTTTVVPADGPVASTVAPPVSVSVSSAGSREVGVLTRVWGRVDGVVEGRVFTQVLVAEQWSTSQIRTSDSTGYFQIPLTYGANTPGTSRWRVGAVTPDGVVYSDEFDFVRTVPPVSVSAASAGSKPVGALTRVWGRVDGLAGGRVFTQVLVGDRWSTSQIRTSDSTGYFQIPLTYGANTPGTLRWRVGVVVPGGYVFSDEFDFTRTVPPVSVSATTGGPTPVGATLRVSGRVDGFTGGRVFTQVLLSGGWSTSQIRTSNSSGSYQIPLTYGANTVGTLRWRVGAVTPGGVVFSDEFDVTRTQPPPRQLHLSFDDGPSAFTGPMLDVLARYNARATFFPVGLAVNSGASLLRRAVAEGHAIGNHTWNHPSLRGISSSRFRSEVLSTQNAIQAATGVRPTCLRPPYGATDSLTTPRAAALGLSVELWDVDPQDWRRPGSSVIASRVIRNARPGSVVVMHDGGGTRTQTVAAVEQILAYFSARGWVFTPMPGC